MANEYDEFRKSERIFFKQEDNYLANLNLKVNEQNTLVNIYILSLSTGGLSFSIEKKYESMIKSMQNILIEYKHPSFPLGSNGELKLLIKYKLNYDDFTYITVGCKFTKIEENELTKINQFITDKIMEINQDSDLNISDIN